MIVITGAAGLLGISLVLHARERRHEVVAITNRHVIEVPGVQCVQVDLCDSVAVEARISEIRPTLIIHCAAATDVDWCEVNRSRALEINAKAVGFLARTAWQTGAGFLYVSSDAVFDGRQGRYLEDDAPAPLSVYGYSKLEGEKLAAENHPKAAIVRITPYGWNAQFKQSLAEWFLFRWRAGLITPGFADLFFTPILVNDAVSVMLDIAERQLEGVFHVAGSERLSKFEFGCRLAGAFGFPADNVINTHSRELGRRAPRPADASLRTEKISVALGRSMPGVESGLDRFMDLARRGYPESIRRMVRRNSA